MFGVWIDGYDFFYTPMDISLPAKKRAFRTNEYNKDDDYNDNKT